jgi:urease accessory protein
MLLFSRIHEGGLAAAEAASAVRLRLTYDERAKSRLATMSNDGRAVAILLPDHRRGSVLRGGTVLFGDAGDFAIVEAASQPVARITADSTLALLRATYHLANRHVPAQLAADAVLIERDPVLEAMLRGLGVHVEHLEAPFDPEGGAYEGHHHHKPPNHADADEVSATVGEQLSIAAHRNRGDIR